MGSDTPTIGYIAQWLERLTADQQVPGSNPGVPFAVYITFGPDSEQRSEPAKEPQEYGNL